MRISDSRRENTNIERVLRKCASGAHLLELAAIVNESEIIGCRHENTSSFFVSKF